MLTCFFGCWEEHIKKNESFVGIGVCIQNVTTPKTEVHLMSSGRSHLPGQVRMPKIEVD